MNLYFDETEAIALLQEKGYRIIKINFESVENISSVKKLIEFFYARRFYYNKNRKFPLSIDYSKDSKFAADLVKSRQKLGLNRKNAIKESALIIDALFKYEKFLKLKEPICHLNIVTSRPIIDRVCTFLNEEVSEVNELETNEYIDKVNKLYEKTNAELEFDNAAKTRKKLLEKIVYDGQKRERS